MENKYMRRIEENEVSRDEILFMGYDDLIEAGLSGLVEAGVYENMNEAYEEVKIMMRRRR